MKTTSVATSLFLLALTMGAHAADTDTPGGAALSTPGTENKGNPVAVPDRATESAPETVPPAGAAIGTPGSENKGNPVALPDQGH
jgi:hypothetical protein